MAQKSVDSLKDNLDMYGFDRYKSMTYKRHYDALVKHVRDVVDGHDVYTPQDDNLQKLHDDPIESMREFMRQEIMQTLKYDTVLVVTDNLKQAYPELFESNQLRYFPMYYSKRLGKYVLSSDYRSHGIRPNEVDPLRRFTFEDVDTMKALYDQIVDDNQHVHYAYRSLIAHQACLGENCFHCGQPKVMLNSYTAETRYFYDWNRLVCQSCGSVYYLKSANNSHEILERLQKGIINNGTVFEGYYALKRSLPPEAAIYVAYITRESEVKSGDTVWPVYCAKVVDVQPSLKPKSFDLNGQMRMYTRIWLRPGSDLTSHWFNVPVVDYDSLDIALELLDSM